MAALHYVLADVASDYSLYYKIHYRQDKNMAFPHHAVTEAHSE
jgi:hypothetical protein